MAGTVGNQISGLRGTPVPLWDEARAAAWWNRRPDGGERPVLVTDDWPKIRSTGYEIAPCGSDLALAGADAQVPSARPVAVATDVWFDTPVDNVDSPARHLAGLAS